MAARPVFRPSDTSGYLVDEVFFEFAWHPGMAPSQKKRNVEELHRAAGGYGLSPLLEISSKSEEEVGRRLSAFNLKVRLNGYELPLESAFQGSKVFTTGGPYQDLYEVEPGQARRDTRIRESGRIIAFRFGDETYPSEPTTGFYDWLYIRALAPHVDWLKRKISNYAGFTDIEFNPEKSVNCQARSLALLFALEQRSDVSKIAHDFWALTTLFHKGRYWRPTGPGAKALL